ncbi:hypothetical protein BH24PSE2_BH24PSE2_17500 [soil metagenome]
MPARKAKRIPPGWLPDWRDETAYPSSLLRSEWRWQFLRRRDDYQSDYAEWRGSHPEEWAGEFAAMVGNPESREKYGTHYLLDPATPAAPVGFFQPAAPYFIPRPPSPDVRLPDDPGLYAVVFNVNEPLTSQFERTQKILTEWQRAYGKKIRPKPEHRQAWAIYLRILDARAGGAILEEIGEALRLLSARQRRDGISSKQKASDTYQAACETQMQLTAGRE